MTTAKLFKNGQSQAVRLPKEFRFQGDEVYVRKLGDAVILLPKNRPWGTLLASLDQFSTDFMEERTQPSIQTRDTPFK